MKIINKNNASKGDPSLTASDPSVKLHRTDRQKHIEELKRGETENLLNNFKDIFNKTKDISLLLSKLAKEEDKEILSSALMVTLILEIKKMQDQLRYMNNGYMPGTGTSNPYGPLPDYTWTTNTGTPPFTQHRIPIEDAISTTLNVTGDGSGYLKWDDEELKKMVDQISSGWDLKPLEDEPKDKPKDKSKGKTSTQ